MLMTQDVKKLSLVFERTSILSYSRFQSNAQQNEGVIFLLTSLTTEKLGILFCFVLYSLSEKKKRVLLELTEFYDGF